MTALVRAVRLPFMLLSYKCMTPTQMTATQMTATQMTSTQRRSTDDRSALRATLIAATVDIINRGGVSSATSRAIADEAGANLGAITYYFGSKDSLIATALAEIGRTLLAPAIDVLTNSDSPLEQLQGAIGLLPRILGENPDALRGYVHALAVAVTDPAVRQELAALHLEIIDLLTNQITSHQAAGVVPAWVRPRAMAETIVTLVDGVAVTTAAGLTDSTPTEVGTEFGALLLHAAVTGQNSD